MALHQRVKTALDETRTIILGAQILLGFQFQGVFQDRFHLLSAPMRALHGLAFGLVLLTVGLLVAPSTFHRIAERGESTGRVQRLAGRFAAAALLPLAVALGLDLAIAMGRLAGEAAAMAWGIGFAALALAAWYGAGAMIKRRRGAAERAKAAAEHDRREVAPLHARIEQMLTEARVILPGAQALLGFQLVIVLGSVFETLPAASRLLHGAALAAVALSVILLVTPAALHRIVWAGEDSEELLRLGGRLTLAALVPLALGMAGDAYVVFARIGGSALAGAVAGVAAAVGLLGFWLAWPLAARRRRAGGAG